MHPHEVEIAQYLCSGALTSDENNYSVPVVEVLHTPDTPEITIIVMPLLKRFDEPRFDTIGEVVECLRQYVEVNELLVSPQPRLS